MIPRCPFCGGHAHLGSKVNETPAMGSGPVFQGCISCVDIDCLATVFYNAETREAAQQGVIERWSRRHAPSVAGQ
ncbi:Lar family restriction alleviation protein [Variovorax gossypii]|uniref:Lar family restriction alleviation protein n=1 Tax=uncultured Variovorax sp. TaxID=114708 RepID=UPI00345CF83D